MDEEETVHADYAADPLVWDEGFRTELLSKIAEAGVAIRRRWTASRKTSKALSRMGSFTWCRPGRRSSENSASSPFVRPDPSVIIILVWNAHPQGLGNARSLFV